jgi:hypothetical protein
VSVEDSGVRETSVGSEAGVPEGGPDGSTIDATTDADSSTEPETGTDTGSDAAPDGEPVEAGSDGEADAPGDAYTDGEADAHGDAEADAHTDAADAGCTGTAPTAPTASPAGGTQDNDFQVALTAAVGDTICYTLDGTTPSCDDGTCGTSSKTYKADVAIDGTTTNASGEVVLHAISCKAGVCGTGTMTPQTYTLQAAAPAFASPAPSPPDVAYPGANPSVSTATTGTVQLRYTSNGTAPTCTTGTLLAAPYPAKLPVTQDITYQVIACKTGYAPSTVTDAAYTVQLGAPTFTPTSADAIATAQPNVTVTVGNPSAMGALCVTADGSTPVCTAGACTHGSSTAAQSITKNGEALEALVCGVTGKYADSAAAKSGAYTLQLAPSKIAPAATVKMSSTGLLSGVQITSSGTAADQPYSFICWSTDGTSTPTCACTGATAENATATVGPGLYKSTGAYTPVMSVQAAAKATSITVRAIGCDSSTAAYTASDAPYASQTWQ